MAWLLWEYLLQKESSTYENGGEAQEKILANTNKELFSYFDFLSEFYILFLCT